VPSPAADDTCWWPAPSGAGGGAGGAFDDAWSPERRIVNGLRAAAPWTTVTCDFDEFPAGALLAHWRIVVSRPYITPVGEDILDFAAKYCFEG